MPPDLPIQTSTCNQNLMIHLILVANKIFICHLRLKVLRAPINNELREKLF